MTFRGGIHAIAFVLAACFVGCGLSLTTTEVGADGGTDASTDSSLDTSVDGPSLVELEVKAEEGGAKLEVDFVAMGANEDSGKIVALTHESVAMALASVARWTRLACALRAALTEPARVA